MIFSWIKFSKIIHLLVEYSNVNKHYTICINFAHESHLTVESYFSYQLDLFCIITYKIYGLLLLRLHKYVWTTKVNLYDYRFSLPRLQIDQFEACGYWCDDKLHWNLKIFYHQNEITLMTCLDVKKWRESRVEGGGVI